MMYLCLGLLAWLAALVNSQTTPPCICLQEYTPANDLRNPVIFKHAGDGSGRLFIGEQLGLVWIFDSQNNRLPEPFLNLTAVVDTSERPGDERGLLQIHFDPNFSTNRKLFLYYNVVDNDDMYTILTEIEASATNPNVVDYNTQRLLIEIFQPFANHNGGDILFGRDNLLYLFTGDGGAAGDPFNLALDRTNLLGKVLRIDPHSRTDNLPYGIPPDNPYLSDPTARRELYAVGLRNPWRCDYDESYNGTEYGNQGRIFIADVGQNEWEEVNLLQRQANFEWACREGPDLFEIDVCEFPDGTVSDAVPPIHSYPHSIDRGRSITGGHMYQGQDFPNFRGKYFFSEYMTGQLFWLEQQGSTWPATEIFTCNDENYPDRNTQCEDLGLVGDYRTPGKWRHISHGEDARGEQYLCTTDIASPMHTGGRVYRFIDPTNYTPPP